MLRPSDPPCNKKKEVNKREKEKKSREVMTENANK
jgi:hypothetical protein